MSIIRLVACMSLCSTMIVASPGFAQQQVSLNIKNVTLEQGLKSLQTASGCYILYNVQDVRNIKNLTVSVQDASVEKVLSLMLQNTSLLYTVNNETILITRKGEAAPQQVRTVAGMVRDEQGAPLIGVTVVVKGTTIGISTGVDGKFVLRLPEQEVIVLVFSYVGMERREVRYTGQEHVEVVMKESVESLSDVVITGYQTISSERTAGSFGSITTQDVGRGQTTNITQRMEGAIPGLVVYNNTVTIRGVSTINGDKTPLYVVDGFPLEGDINSINPNDVKSITVLKDASAASIYGARAANGVIVVTTHSGSMGAAKFTYEGNFSITPKANFDKYNLSSSAELVDLEVESFERYFSKNPWSSISSQKTLQTKVYDILYKGKTGVLNDQQVNQQLDELRKSDNRKQLHDYIYRAVKVHRHNISMTGGDRAVNYYISGSYQGTFEQLQGNKSDVVNLNLRLNAALKSWLRMDVGSALVINKRVNNAFAGNLLSFPSYEMLKDNEGNNLYFNYDKPYYEIERLLNNHLYDERYSPLEQNEHVNRVSKDFNTRNFIALRATIIEGLSVEGKYQFERGASKNSNFYDEFSKTSVKMVNDFAQIAAATGAITFNIPYGGQLQETRGDHFSQTFRLQLNYDGSFGNGEHEISAIAGAERRKITTSSTTSHRFGYSDKTNMYMPVDSKVLSFLSSTQSMNGYAFYNETQNNSFSEFEDRYVSFYGNLAYTYNDRYTATASIRVDQSNLWGTDPKVQYKPLWSVGGLWRVDRESFFNLSWVDRLNLRLTYGINGNIPKDTGPYAQLSSSYSTTLQTIGNSVSSPPNYNLTWEKTAVTNVGVDFSVLNNRISGLIEYYSRNTTDLLGSVVTDPTQGFTSVKVNYGSMYNRGIEIGINTLNVNTKDFSWKTSLNLAYNKNKMTDVENTVTSVSGWAGRTPYVVGKAYNSVYAYRWAGLSDTGEPLVYNEKDEKVDKTSGVTSTNALACIGTLSPKYTGGLTNSLRYRDWDLSFFFVYNGGHIFKKDVPLISGRLSTNYNTSLNPRWKVAGDENKTDVPKFDVSPDNVDRSNVYENVEQHWVVGDFLKLRDIVFSYGIPKQVLHRCGIGSAVLKFQARNIFHWSKNADNLDPESSSRNPLQTNYSFGLNVTF